MNSIEIIKSSTTTYILNYSIYFISRLHCITIRIRLYLSRVLSNFGIGIAQTNKPVARSIVDLGQLKWADQCEWIARREQFESN